MPEKLIYKEETDKIIKAALKVHKILGPGFSERIYEHALKKEFGNEGIAYQNQKRLDIYYNDEKIGYQIIDFLVDSRIIVELKSVNKLENFYLSQVISYLKAARLPVGLVLNFAQPILEIKRVVNSEFL